MKKNHLRAAAAAMTAAILMTTLTGCSRGDGIGGSNNGGGKSGGLEISLDHSYSSEKVQIEGISYASGALSIGDKMLIAASDEQYNEIMYLYDPADGSTKKVEFNYPKTLGEGEDAWPNSYFVDSSGNLNVVFSGNAWTIDDDGEEQYQSLGLTVETYDADFNPTGTVQLDPEELGTDYVSNVAVDQNGNYFISSWDDNSGSQVIGIFDKDFKKTGQIQGDMQYVQGMFVSKSGDVYLSYYTQEGENTFGKIDAASGTVQALHIEGMPQWFNEGFASQDDSYDFYLYDSTAVYGVNVQRGVCEEVVNWINSDFLGNSVGELSQLPDGRFILSTTVMNADDNSELWVLSPRDPDAFKDVNLISMAGLYLPDELGEAVLSFNRTHDKERIAIVNYEKYNTEDDYTAALTKLKNDMTSGIVADLIITAGLPYESLANKGLFEDLRPYMSELNEADYFTSFFDSMAYGDKLYNIGFSFDVTTVEGKSSVVGTKQGLTTAEYMDLLKSMPSGTEAFTDMTKDSALYALALSNLSAYTDVRNATCSFNSPEFISLLEFCNTFPAEYEDKTASMSDDDREAYWEEQDSQYINDKTALSRIYISNVRDAYQQRMSSFGETDVTRIGYPVADENSGNGGCFSAYNTIAMSANSANKEICWEFINTMLSDDYQNSLQWSLPVKRSAYDKLVEEAMKPQSYIDENGKEVEYENTIYRGNQEIKIPNMPKSFADELESYIEGIRVNSYYDDQIYNIVTEEAQMYFTGDQTAEKAAEMIQSRASLYLSEQG